MDASFIAETTSLQDTVRKIYQSSFSESVPDDSLQDSIQQILYFVRQNPEEPFQVPYHILLTSNDKERTDNLTEGLAKAIEQITEGKNHLHQITADIFISEGISGSDCTANDIVCIRPLTEENAEKFIPALHIVKEHPELHFLLCSDEETVSHHIAPSPDLYYRTFTNHIRIKPMSTKDCCAMFLRRLSRDYEPTESFSKEICHHIRVIYPTAELRDSAFVEDLVRRVLTKRRTKPITGRFIDVDCVPERDKTKDYERLRAAGDTEALETARANANAELWDPIENKIDFLNEDPLASVSNTEPPQEFLSIPQLLRYSEGQTNTKENRDAVIFLFLSKLSKRSKEEYYNSPEQNKYFGIQTIDAPIQYLIDTINKDGNNLKKILCICSKEDVTEKYGECTAFNRLEKLVREYTKDEKLPIVEIPYKYAYTNQDNKRIPLSMEESANKIYASITKELSELNSPTAYVEYTGGQRDIALLMLTIIRYIQFGGLTCKKIIYANFNNEEKTLCDIGYIYDIFNILDGTSEFISYANSRQLEKTFKETNNESLRDLLKNINAFSDAISICDMSNIEVIIRNVFCSINEFEKKCSNKDSLDVQMLYTLIPLIREKMYFNKGLVYDNGKLNYPVLIKWCTDNRFIQQAFTLYVEKMPDYYEKKGLFNRIPISHSNAKDNAEKFYTKLFSFAFDKAYDTNCSAFTELYQTNHLSGTDPQAIIDKIGRINTSNLSFCLKRSLQRMSILLNQLDQKGAIDFNNHYYPCTLRMNEDFLESPSQNLMRYCIDGMEEKSPDAESIVYEKKTIALENIIAGITGYNITGKTELVSIMAYYLAIKLLRNRTNHAKQQIFTSGEEFAKKCLEQVTNLYNGKRIRIDTEIPTVSALLLNGTEVSQKIDSVQISKQSRNEFSGKQRKSSSGPKEQANVQVPKNVINSSVKTEQTSSMTTEESNTTNKPLITQDLNTVSLPEAVEVDGVNSKLIEKLAKLVILTFRNCDFTSQEPWKKVQEKMEELFSPEVPCRSQISPTTKTSIIKALKSSYPEVFTSKEDVNNGEQLLEIKDYPR